MPTSCQRHLTCRSILQVESLQLQLRTSEDRCAALEGLRADLEAMRAACRSAEETAERRGAEIKKMQQSAQSAEMLRKYQDICLVSGDDISSDTGLVVHQWVGIVTVFPLDP